MSKVTVTNASKGKARMAIGTVLMVGGGFGYLVGHLILGGSVFSVGLLLFLIGKAQQWYHN